MCCRRDFKLERTQKTEVLRNTLSLATLLHCSLRLNTHNQAVCSITSFIYKARNLIWFDNKLHLCIVEGSDQ